MNKEAIGLQRPPTDLHLLQDGRVLVVAGRQLAFGDGVRWEVFNQADNEPDSRAQRVAVDEDGSVYQAIDGGFARVVFLSNGRWRLQKVADWPAEERTNRPVPRQVIMAGGEWFWHSGSGSIIAWRPGQSARSAGVSDTVAHIFQFNEEFYVCDWNLGGVTRLKRPGQTTADGNPRVLERVFLTSSASHPSGRLLVGTNTYGLQLFDGKELQALPAGGSIGGGRRINSLCRVGVNYYAVALENHGVIFCNNDGKAVQTLDHRLGRVLRLRSDEHGTVWGLLDEGVFRVDFPSRISHFEPVINVGFESIHPTRLDGRLWLNGDNRVLRAVYEADGRLSGFTTERPGGENAFSLSMALGFPIVGATTGAYYLANEQWVQFATASNLRIAQSDPIDGAWFYCARNEAGWIHRTEHGTGLSLTRHPLPGLGTVYNAATDGQGVIWLEFGTGRLGRLEPGRPGGAPPRLQQLSATEGVPTGWPQVFVLDGVARFNIADRILRYDETTGHLVPDADFAAKFSGLGTLIGRPGRDAQGRLWITSEKGVHIFTGDLDRLQPVSEPMPAGFQPYYFTFESGGVVWMHTYRRLARYDPTVAIASEWPLRVLITHVSLPASQRVLFPRNGRLPDLNYRDNSLVPHFLAVGNTLAAPVTFEVKLPGQDWVSTGGLGSTILNQLDYGPHLLQVRARSGARIGEPAQLAFTILPPWYRTPLAYGVAVLLFLGCIWLLVWLVTYLQRREKQRLERLVTQRTRELNESNTRLAQQIEEVRLLTQAIEQSPVGVIITTPEGRIVFANPPVCHLSGYSRSELLGKPVRMLRQPATMDATLSQLEEALHKGHSWDGQLANQTKDGRVVQMHVTALPLRNTGGNIQHHLYLEEDITEWLAAQDRRRRLDAQLFQAQKRESLGTLAGGIAHDFNNILTGILGYCELARLTLGDKSPVEQELAAIAAAGRRARDLVSQILSFTRPGSPLLVTLDLAGPVSEALKLFRASTPANIELVQELQSGTVRADASQIHQVVLNLCTNAAHALRRRQAGCIKVRLEPVTLDAAQAAELTGLTAGDYMQLQVSDNGIGMEPALLDRIFDPFFTTKDPGEGTGLGLAIVQSIVTAHQGAIRVKSTPGHGTTFDLFFPISDESNSASAPPVTPPAGNHQEILVVDDEPMVTDFTAARLGKLGYLPQVRHDPREALELLTAQPARFAALITDLTMPHLSGVELIHQLQARGIHLPTLIITGYNRNSARADLASVPDIPILQKPFTGEELAQALHRVLQAGGCA